MPITVAWSTNDQKAMQLPARCSHNDDNPLYVLFNQDSTVRTDDTQSESTVFNLG